MANIYRKSEIPADLLEFFEPAEIGLEDSPDAYVAKMVEVFAAVRRVLRDDGTLWLNIGDSYANDAKWGGQSGSKNYTSAAGGYSRDRKATGLKPKDLCMIPWRVALALQADGWWIRSVIVWAKKSPMPESVTDRPTSAWEPIFLLAKSERYYYDAEAVKEASVDPESLRGRGHRNEDAFTQANGDTFAATRTGFSKIEVGRTYPTRNQRNVWHLGPEPFAGCHFATFPTEIPRRAIKAGTSEKGACPACGAPWTRVVERGTNGMDEANAHERTGDWTQERSGKAKCPSGLIVSGRTSGWAPGCDCNAGEPVPCVVLDPFLGSGTTIAVARQLGRHGVGCELNPEYVELAKVRIGKAEKPHTFQDTREEDAPLFGTLREVSP